MENKYERKLEILLVEDDPFDCQNMINGFEDYPDDFELIGVTNNSNKAYDYVQNLCPDVLILDLELHLGGGDGIDLLKKMQALQGTPPPYRHNDE